MLLWISYGTTGGAPPPPKTFTPLTCLDFDIYSHVNIIYLLLFSILEHLPCDSIPYLLDGIPYPLDSIPYPLDCISYPLDNIPYSLDCIPYPLDHIPKIITAYSSVKLNLIPEVFSTLPSLTKTLLPCQPLTPSMFSTSCLKRKFGEKLTSTLRM